MSLTRDLRRTFAEGYDLLRRGELRTLVPFLPMFRVNGRPMTLRMHYQFAPLFATTQPANTVVMCGRQEGKSNQMCASNLLRSMLIPFYHTMIVQPQMDQILRLMATVYRPLLSSCPIVGEFISPDEMRKTSLREFRNGSLCYAEHLKFSPDRTRGAGNIASVYFDESLRGDTLIVTIVGGRLKFKKIRDVKQKDFILSLDNDGKSFMLSVADRNASYHGTRACFKVTTVTGRQVVCTADHEFLTDHGWMRLEEIIEHEHLERSRGNRDERGAGERHHGEPAGGRLPAEVLRQGEGAPLEPRREADGVPAVEVSRLVRVRTARTVY